MARRRRWIAVLLLVSALAGAGAVAMMITAARPVLSVMQDAPPDEPPSVAALRRELEPAYGRILDAVSSGDPSSLSGLLTPGFVYDSIFMDRTYEITQSEWESQLRNWAARAARLPAAVSPDGLQVERTRKYTLRIGRIRLQGRKADVFVSVDSEFGRSRFPVGARFLTRQNSVSRDTWEHDGKAWKLARIKTLRTTQVRESVRERE